MLLIPCRSSLPSTVIHFTGAKNFAFLSLVFHGLLILSLMPLKPLKEPMGRDVKPIEESEPRGQSNKDLSVPGENLPYFRTDHTDLGPPFLGIRYFAKGARLSGSQLFFKFN